jgi:DNA-binding transcriptional MerR regulator
MTRKEIEQHSADIQRQIKLVMYKGMTLEEMAQYLNEKGYETIEGTDINIWVVAYHLKEVRKTLKKRIHEVQM